MSKAEGERSAAAGLGEPPDGWNATDPKTGAPVGIDKGFDYAPGASWHPNLDKYPHALAHQVVRENLEDGVFERWHKHIAERVATELTLPEYAGLDKSGAIDKLRLRLSAGENYTVAVLPPNTVAMMGLDTQSVLISDYDLIKQQFSRTGQGFSALDYLNTQGALDDPRLVVRENAQMTLFVSDESGKWYAAVLQQTKTGKGLFLKSLRRSSEKDALVQRKKGDVLHDSLGKQ